MQYLKLRKEELVEKFVEKLLPTNRGFNFYVDWRNAKVYKNFEIELNAMNCLVRNDNFDTCFRDLLKKLPSVVSTFPYLFALAKEERKKVWSGKEKLLVVNGVVGEEDYLEYSFSDKNIKKGLTNEEIENQLLLFERMGLKELFLNLLEKNVLDYVIGVLVGLDSNGRKNRGGLAFELACEPLIKEVCSKNGIKYYFQKPFKTLITDGIKISDDIKNRKADFILARGNKLLNIEVNFFHGSGSKPEEIIDSYINRQNDLIKAGIEFVLITDGEKCWGNNTKSQLLKGFRNLKYLMNYNLAKDGMLEEIIKEIF